MTAPTATVSGSPLSETSNELLPCPFCGGAPMLIDAAGWESHCDCGASMCLSEADREPLVAAWNRRALSAPVATPDDARFKAHTQAVADFLNELYAVMVDPVAEGSMSVRDMKDALLQAALKSREAALATQGAPVRAECKRVRDALDGIAPYLPDLRSRTEGAMKRTTHHCYRSFLEDKCEAIADLQEVCAALAAQGDNTMKRDDHIDLSDMWTERVADAMFRAVTEAGPSHICPACATNYYAPAPMYCDRHDVPLVRLAA